MKKRIISTFLAAVMTFSTISLMNSTAILVQNTEGSESYNARIENYNENLTPAPELTELLNDILTDSNVKNVWIQGETTSDFSYYKIEILDKDFVTLRLDIDSDDCEQIINMLESELGYKDNVEIKLINPFSDDYYGINITFTDEDHELNYMIAEKAYSIVEEKYTIEDIHSQFANRRFLDTMFKGDYNSFDSIDGILWYKEKQEYQTRLTEIYETAPHDTLREKYRAVLNENGTLEFPEDITDIEKLGCYKYFVENYNVTIHTETLASNQSNYLANADFQSTGIYYLNGDANCDQKYTIADSTAILQALGNPDKYGLSTQGLFNADSTGDGLTVEDAVAIKTALAKGA